MMKKETAERIEALRNKVGNELFNKDAVENYVSISTLKKYDLIETVTIANKKEVSVDDLINEINSMIGEDCYGMEGEYVRENNKIYYVTYRYGYKFK